VDQEYANLYKNEELIARLTSVSAVLTILISSLGLLGLVMYSVEQRTKEFGIRKVLGASGASIIGLLSKDFIKLILIAFCIAAPFAWFFMHGWLQQFAFQIDLSWWMFALAGGAALLMAMLTIGYQAMRATMVNPAKNLKSE
jgi:ABC-type antimicrobial peptide transport system permease subunit